MVVSWAGSALEAVEQMSVFPGSSVCPANRGHFQVVVNAIVLSWVTHTMSDQSGSSGPSLHAQQHIERHLRKDDASRSTPPAVITNSRQDIESGVARSPKLQGLKSFFNTRTSSDSDDDHVVTSLEASPFLAVC